MVYTSSSYIQYVVLSYYYIIIKLNYGHSNITLHQIRLYLTTPMISVIAAIMYSMRYFPPMN